MKIFCGTFGYFLYHPEDTGIICKSRALKLRLPQCCSCLGIEVPESPQENPSPVVPLPTPTAIPTPLRNPSPDSAILEWIKEQGMAEIGRMLGVSRFAVKKWLDRGRIPKRHQELLYHLMETDQDVNISSSIDAA